MSVVRFSDTKDTDNRASSCFLVGGVKQTWGGALWPTDYRRPPELLYRINVQESVAIQI